ncbi:MAG: threonylcarbamoyl-AMP synthase [Chitinophaga sp.]|nr:threonylcarbamoyl-AMP synthase [Chitinophaga sp.]
MIDFTNDIESCLQTLKSGGIILYPTDTIWGIGCDATNEAAIEKIIALKKRPSEKSFVVLVADERTVLQHATNIDLAVFDFLETTEKPTTVIYENAIGFADTILASDGSVAIRICNDEFCRHLIKRFQKPLVSTSANISGMAYPEIFNDIDANIKQGVDYIVQYRQNETRAAQASSIIKWVDGKPVFIR